MIIIVCLDDKDGMMFAGRRQSKDSLLRQRVLALAEGKKLWMNAYSKKQFGEVSAVTVDEDFLNKAQKGDLCFVEDKKLCGFESAAERIIVYRWNRVYPSDFVFDIPLRENGWRRVSVFDFAGKSHDRISEEVYER